jgi:UDP-N-acetylglucosamine acyltransferase
MIHPTAVIHPKAQIDPSVVVGPYAIIDENVSLAAGCRVGPHVYLTGHTTIGANNVFHAGAVIGDAPQDLKYKNEPTRLRIGDNNLFRENVTVHRSNTMSEDTVIGSGNFFMAGSHVGHNCIVGDNNILANGALLGGHVTVADRVFISGNCAVHQFVRVGKLSLMQGGSVATQDVPPFSMMHEVNVLCGLNMVGLRRAGFQAEERMELKRLYNALFRQGKNLRAAVAEARQNFSSENARLTLDFIASTKRGICTPLHRSSSSPEENSD